MSGPKVIRVHNDCRNQAGAYSDPEYVLTLVRGGLCDYRIADRRYLVKRGHVILLQPHLPHLLIPQDQAIDHLVVHVSATSASGWLRHCPEVIHCSARRRQRLERWFKDLDEQWQQGDANHEAICTALAQAILHDYHRGRDIQAPTKIDRSAGWPLVERSLDYMHKHYGAGIGIQDIARTHNISAAHLSRAFQLHTGRGPAQMLQEIRIERAQELLHQGSLSCAAIAKQCGFASLPAFSRSFKRQTGQAPTAWLAQILSQTHKSLPRQATSEKPSHKLG